MPATLDEVDWYGLFIQSYREANRISEMQMLAKGATTLADLPANRWRSLLAAGAHTVSGTFSGFGTTAGDVKAEHDLIRDRWTVDITHQVAEDYFEPYGVGVARERVEKEFEKFEEELHRRAVEQYDKDEGIVRFQGPEEPEVEEELEQDLDGGFVEEGLTSREEPAERQPYVVQRDESFWTIARDQFLQQTGITPDEEMIRPYWKALVAANRDALLDPDNPSFLRPGQELEIPTAVDRPWPSARRAWAPRAGARARWTRASTPHRGRRGNPSDRHPAAADRSRRRTPSRRPARGQAAGGELSRLRQA